MKKKLVLMTSALMAVSLLAGCGNKHTHEWGDVSYTWADDNSTCTALRTCKGDATHVETETVNATYTVIEQAKCEAAGKGKYTADFVTNEAFVDQTKEVVIKAAGHNWGDIKYEWTPDFSECTATRTCKNDATHVETETVGAEFVYDKEPTSSTLGNGKFVATFTNKEFGKKESGTYVVPKLTFSPDMVTLMVTSSSDAEGDVFIPASFDGKDISSIDSSSFLNANKITSVIFSEKINTIKQNAFKNCANLKSLLFKDRSTYLILAFSSFEDCINLKSIDFGKSTGDIDINDSVFKNCGFETFVLPKSVNHIGCNAFESCASLKSFSFGENEYIEGINDSTFKGCSALESVTFSSNMPITMFFDSVFEGCKSLKTLELPSAFVSLGENCLKDCEALTKITFAGTKDEWFLVKKETGWNDGAGLQTVVCSNGEYSYVPTLDKLSFTADATLNYSVKAISKTIAGEVIIPAVYEDHQVVKIVKDAFNGCTGVTTVRIPHSITSVEIYAFNSCSLLTDIYYEGTKAEWNNIAVKYWALFVEFNIHYTDGNIDHFKA